MSLFSKQLGSAGPLISFESGIAASHLNWMGIAPRVAEFGRVFLYDRAGYGYSPPKPEPRTASQCASEVPLQEPAILVGHSFGSLIARTVAEKQPKLVQALVLIDPIVLSEWWPETDASRRRLIHGQRVARLLTWAARARIIKPGIALFSRNPSKASPAAQQLFDELKRLPPETWPVIREHWSKPQSFITMRRYMETLSESCREGLKFRSIGDIPLTVISGAHLPEEALREHQRWAQCSTRGKHLIAPSGRHWVHLDEPDFVIEAIRETCQQLAQPA